MMAKRIVRLVTSCRKCPNSQHSFGVRGTSGPESGDHWYCQHPSVANRVIGRWVGVGDPIPGWCPLEDEPA